MITAWADQNRGMSKSCLRIVISRSRFVGFFHRFVPDSEGVSALD